MRLHRAAKILNAGLFYGRTFFVSSPSPTTTNNKHKNNLITNCHSDCSMMLARMMRARLPTAAQILCSRELQTGIVGLPNVGKSTLFNALIGDQLAAAENYPFCTIEPNSGLVSVPDKRLHALGVINKSVKVVPTIMEFVDIAG